MRARRESIRHAQSLYFADFFTERRLPGLLRRFGLDFVRCCGGLFATTSTARSKRRHAFSANSIFAFALLLGMTKPDQEAEQKQTDELYLAVGKALSAWSLVEQTLAGIFSTVVVQGRFDPVGSAQIAFWAVESFVGKITMIDGALKFRCYDNPELIGEWETIFKRAREKNNLRNELAHGIVMRFGNFDPVEVWFVPFFFKATLREIYDKDPFKFDLRPNRRLSARQINDRTKAFKEFRERLADFNARLMDSLGKKTNARLGSPQEHP
jgi:hypothetical protein